MGLELRGDGWYYSLEFQEMLDFFYDDEKFYDFFRENILRVHNLQYAASFSKLNYIVIIVALIAFFLISSNVFLFFIFIFLFVSAIIVAIVVSASKSSSAIKLTKKEIEEKQKNVEFKTKVMPILFSKFPFIKWNNASKTKYLELKNIGLLKRRGGLKYLDEYFTCEFKGRNIEVFEIFLDGYFERNVVRGGWSMLTRIPCPSHINGNIYILPIDKANDYNNNDYFKYIPKVYSDESIKKICQKFDIYATDEMFATSILTKDFIEQFMQIFKIIKGKELLFSIEDGYINIISTKLYKDSFEFFHNEKNIIKPYIKVGKILIKELSIAAEMIKLFVL